MGVNNQNVNKIIKDISIDRNKNTLLNRAIELATEFHYGQMDKNGVDYINHPLAVMDGVSSAEAKMVAVMHDLLEDTDLSLEDLKKENFSIEVLEALKLLNHKKGEAYMEYIQKISGNELAKEVKIADIKHNLDEERLKLLDEETIKRLKNKYNTALDFLSKK